MARFRSLRIAMAFHAADRLQDVPEALLEQITTLEGWKKFSRRDRHGGGR